MLFHTQLCVEVYFAIVIGPRIAVGGGFRRASTKALPPYYLSRTWCAAPTMIDGLLCQPCMPSAATFSDNGES
jgi:hypothetical protein